MGLKFWGWHTQKSSKKHPANNFSLLIFTFPDRNHLKLLYDDCSHLWSNRVKGALLSLRQFLAIGSPLKMKKNALYFTPKALLRYGKHELRVESLKERVEIQKCELESNPRVTSSNPRVTSSNPRVQESLKTQWKLK